MASFHLSGPTLKRPRLGDSPTDDCLSPHQRNRPHIDSLPKEVVLQIGTYMGSLADLACMARTCHSMLDPIQDVLRHLEPVLNVSLPNTELPQRVHDFIGVCQKAPQLQAFFTPQIAIRLYDRLFNCEYEVNRPDGGYLDKVKASLVALHPIVYGAMLYKRSSAELQAKCAKFLCSELFPPLPPQIMDLAHKLADELAHAPSPLHRYPILIPDIIESVRASLPPPFNRIFPYHDELRAYMLQRKHKSTYSQLLNRYDVMLALLQHGIRFGVNTYFSIVKLDTATDLCRIYPLLDRRGCTYHTVILKTCVERFHMEMFRQFLRIPDVVQSLRCQEKTQYNQSRQGRYLQISVTECSKHIHLSQLSEMIVNSGNPDFIRILTNLKLIEDFAPYLLRYSFERESTEFKDIILQISDVRENRAQKWYSEALYSFIKHENPDSSIFYEMVNSKPFSAQFNSKMRLEIIDAVAFVGNQQLFSDFLSDHAMVEELGKDQPTVLRIFNYALKAQQEDFLHFILHTPGPFHGIIFSKDAILMQALFHAIVKYSSSALGFLKSCISLPQMTEYVNLRCASGYTLLHAAFEAHNMEIVDVLVSSPGIDLHVTDDKGHGPFWYYLSECRYSGGRNPDIWLSLVTKLPMNDPEYRSVIVFDLKDSFHLYLNGSRELVRDILTTHSFMKELVNARSKGRDRGSLLCYALSASNYAAVCDLDSRKQYNKPKCLQFLSSWKLHDVPKEFRSRMHALQKSLKGE